MTKAKKKPKQKDLDGNELPPLSENIERVEFYRLTEETDGFILKTKDTAIEGLDSTGLMNHVRERIRVKKDAIVAVGDFDEACRLIHKQLLEYPR